MGHPLRIHNVAIKVKVPDRTPVAGAPKAKPRPAARRAKVRHFSFRDPLVRIFSAAFVLICVVFFGVASYLYVKYERVVDRRMSGEIFTNAANIYARPRMISIGEKVDASEVAADLRRAGYSEGGGSSPIGRYAFIGDAIQVMPGPQSFHGAGNAVIRFRGGKVSSITETGGERQELEGYELEPQLVTALFEGAGPLQARADQVSRTSRR